MSDTAVRSVVMLAVLGGGAWGAMQYPPIAARVQQVRQDWERGTLLKPRHDGLEQARSAGGDAPAFGQESGGHSDLIQPPASSLQPIDAPRPLVMDESPQPLGAPALLPSDQPRRPLPAEMRQAEGTRNVPAAEPFDAQQVDFRREPSSAGESLADLETRLSRLGASYCLLERWADNPPRYRFHCRVTLSPGAEPRRFEANGSDPGVVMRQVADAIAQCRAQRGP